jgi:hypothetical protein
MAVAYMQEYISSEIQGKPENRDSNVIKNRTGTIQKICLEN